MPDFLLIIAHFDVVMRLKALQITVSGLTWLNGGSQYFLILTVLSVRFVNFAYALLKTKWSRGRVARQRSAKPCTAVRIRP